MTVKEWTQYLTSFDAFLRGWKTLIFLFVVIFAFHVLPEGKLQNFVSALGYLGIATARTAKMVAK